MPLQDLTPQLRTRLSRIERAVGWFITIAVVALVAALGYYIYERAQAKGWFLTKVNYQTSLNNAAGLKVGDPVKLMGFNVGEITRIEANDPNDWYGVSIYFDVKSPYWGYIWMDSKVRVAASDFLGNRSIEIVKGRRMQATARETPDKKVIVLNSVLARDKFKAVRDSLSMQAATNTFHALRTNKTTPPELLRRISLDASNQLNEIIKAQPQVYYTNLANATNYWLEPLESPALTERLETMVDNVQAALPTILRLTNDLTRVLTNAGNAVARLDATVAEAQPLITNLNAITSNLRDTNGSLGTWILGTDLRDRLTSTTSNANTTLIAAQSTLTNADTNLTVLAANLDKTLINLANMTSNLNAQVQQNNHIISYLDVTIAHLDQFVQGLKHHWLLRSAFKNENKTEAKPQKK